MARERIYFEGFRKTAVVRYHIQGHIRQIPSDSQRFQTSLKSQKLLAAIRGSHTAQLQLIGFHSRRPSEAWNVVALPSPTASC